MYSIWVASLNAVVKLRSGLLGMAGTPVPGVLSSDPAAETAALERARAEETDPVGHGPAGGEVRARAGEQEALAGRPGDTLD